MIIDVQQWLCHDKEMKKSKFYMGLQKYLTEKQWDLQSLSFCYLHNIVNISQFCSQPDIIKNSWFYAKKLNLIALGLY